MATSPTSVGVSVDLLSKSERMLCVSSLLLKRASILRAVKSETNGQIVDIRSKEVDEVNALIHKFS